MKPEKKPARSAIRSTCRILSPQTLAAILITTGVSHAASDSWITGTDGAYNDTSNWSGGNVPDGDSDVATIEGSGSIVAFGVSDSFTLQELNFALSATGGAPVFNQSGGILSVGMLGFGGGGGSRNPTYNLSSGTLNIATAFTWGNGSNARFNITGGTVNQGAGALNLGVNGGANGAIVMSGGTFNHTAAAQVGFGTGSTGIGALTMTGGTFNANSATTIRISNSGGGSGSMTLSNDAAFNATAAPTVYLGNNGGVGTLTLSDSSSFNVPSAAISVGQFGNGSGTVNIANDATLNALRMVLGGDNAGSNVFGVINLDGGTISTGQIRLGATAGDNVPLNVLNANGGTVRATTHGGNSNFFLNLNVDLQEGGLNFDTNDNFITVTNPLSGVGGLTKRGEGTLELTAVSTYTGDTLVESGELTVKAAWFDDESHIEVAEDGLLNLDHELLDVVGTLTLAGQPIASGIWGSTVSGAPNTSPLLAGLGRLLVGGTIPEGRDLVWIGDAGAYWSNLPMDENFIVEGGTEAVSFAVGDNVLFDDRGNYDPNIIIDGTVQPGLVTFDASTDFSLTGGVGSGIGGAAAIVKNNANAVTLGGGSSSFTGPVSVNGGRLVMGENQSFGASSGISIAAGAQVDINGKQPGAIYTYTLSGPGPGGAGAIVNSGGEVFIPSGVRHLVLLADSSIGNNGGRFDIAGNGGSITGSGSVRTLTKVGTNGIAIRGAATDIDTVILAGSMWSQHNGAFGGAGNTVTVAGGATTGTWGTFTIPAQVVLQDGANLVNIGSGTGTWTGNVSVAGSFTIGAPQPVVLNGSVSGAASMTKTGGGTLTLGQAPAWTGNTTVSGGTLVLNVEGLADEGNVVLGAGAVLNLAHGQTDTVKTLLLNGVPAAAGTWGSFASAADNKNDTFFQGTGILDVTETALPPARGFYDWVASFEFEDDADAEPGADPDHDGIPNAVEYVLGGDPTVFSTGIRPLFDNGSSGDSIVFIFQRDDASEDGATQVIVQYGTNLAGWTDVPIGAVSGGMVGVEENGDDPDTITVTIPKDGDPKKFVRLKVAVD